MNPSAPQASSTSCGRAVTLGWGVAVTLTDLLLIAGSVQDLPPAWGLPLVDASVGADVPQALRMHLTAVSYTHLTLPTKRIV